MIHINLGAHIYSRLAILPRSRRFQMTRNRHKYSRYNEEKKKKGEYNNLTLHSDDNVNDVHIRVYNEISMHKS